jgi:phage gp46-like protein
MSSDRQKLFGTDLRLRESVGGLDLVLSSPSGSAGDLALAHGNDNIIQALTLALRVRKGELAALGWPDFGSRLHELIGEPDLPRTRLKAQAYARSALEADPRVAEVVSVEVTSIPGERSVLRLAASVLLIHENTPTNLVFNLALEGA